MTVYKDWQEDLVHYLVTAGTVGRQQNYIVVRFKGRADAETLNNELEALLVQDKVQKFIIERPRGGTAPTIWRATTKILEP